MRVPSVASTIVIAVIAAASAMSSATVWTAVSETLVCLARTMGGEELAAVEICLIVVVLKCLFHASDDAGQLVAEGLLFLV